MRPARVGQKTMWQRTSHMSVLVMLMTYRRCSLSVHCFWFVTFGCLVGTAKAADGFCWDLADRLEALVDDASSLVEEITGCDSRKQQVDTYGLGAYELLHRVTTASSNRGVLGIEYQVGSNGFSSRSEGGRQVDTFCWLFVVSRGRSFRLCLPGDRLLIQSALSRKTFGGDTSKKSFPTSTTMEQLVAAAS